MICQSSFQTMLEQQAFSLLFFWIFFGFSAGFALSSSSSSSSLSLPLIIGAGKNFSSQFAAESPLLFSLLCSFPRFHLAHSRCLQMSPAKLGPTVRLSDFQHNNMSLCFSCVFFLFFSFAVLLSSCRKLPLLRHD